MTNPTRHELANNLTQSLKQMIKAQVFAIWCEIFLGRIHNAKLVEQRKSWMIYDIVRSKYGDLPMSKTLT